MDIKEQIRQYMAFNFLFSDGGFDLGDDASFPEEGIVDSTGTLEIVVFVEETFGIEVVDNEIVPNNFNTVNNLAALPTIPRRRLCHPHSLSPGDCRTRARTGLPAHRRRHGNRRPHHHQRRRKSRIRQPLFYFVGL